MDGTWHIRDITTVTFGLGSDYPFAGDYDGDGTTDIALFRSALGLWMVRGLPREYFGQPDDLPIARDYDGDGVWDIAIYRPQTGMWAIHGIESQWFGAKGDFPVLGDFDGDGCSDIGIFRSASGLWAIRETTRLYFGRKEDMPIPGDYDGDGVSEVALYRKSSGLWLIRNLTRVYFGDSGAIPSPLDYLEAGISDLTIFNPIGGVWAIRGITQFYYGGDVDIPLPGYYWGPEPKLGNTEEIAKAEEGGSELTTNVFMLKTSSKRGTGSPSPIPSVTPTPTPTPGWFTDWGYREKITIDADRVPSDQSFFPVLILLNPTQSQVFWYAQTSGNDILFAPGAKEDKWSHEIEDYNSHTQTGQLIAWVSVPQLSSQTDTVFYMYYGNSSASDQQDITNTWDSNFNGVWHLGEGMGLAVGDSTVEGNNGRSQQDTGWTSSTGGEIDGAYDLDGSSDFFTVTDDSSLKPTNITMETWINPEDIPYAASFPGLFDTHYSYAYSFLGKDNDELSAYFHISGNLRVLTTSGLNLGADTWYYVVAKYDGSNIKILVDGVEEASQSVSGSLDTGENFDLLLGNGRGGVTKWKGNLDEMGLQHSPEQ